MNPWRWLFGAKVRVLRLRPGDVVVLEATRPTTPAHLEAVRDRWAELLPDVDMVVMDGLRLVWCGAPTRCPRARARRRPDPTR